MASATHDRAHGKSGEWTTVSPDDDPFGRAGLPKTGTWRIWAVSRGDGEAARDAMEGGSWLGVPGSASEGNCPGRSAKSTQYYLGTWSRGNGSGDLVGCYIGTFRTSYWIYDGTEHFGSEVAGSIQWCCVGPGAAKWNVFPDEPVHPLQVVFRNHFPGDGSAEAMFKKTELASRTSIKAKIRCLEWAEGTCRGTLTATSRVKRSLLRDIASTSASKYRTVKIAQRPIAVKANSTKTFTLRLNRTGRKLVAALGTKQLRQLTTTFQAKVRDGDGHRTTAKKTVKLKAPRQQKKN